MDQNGRVNGASAAVEGLVHVIKSNPLSMVTIKYTECLKLNLMMAGMRVIVLWGMGL